MHARKADSVKKFNTIFVSLLSLTIMNALLPILVGVLDASSSISHASLLVEVFTDSFKMGLAGLFGLLVGSSLR